MNGIRAWGHWLPEECPPSPLLSTDSLSLGFLSQATISLAVTDMRLVQMGEHGAAFPTMFRDMVEALLTMMIIPSDVRSIEGDGLISVRAGFFAWLILQCGLCID